MEKELNKQACRIIEALGGTSATARLCNVAPPSVTEWKSSGVPDARLMFLKLARPEVFAEIALQDEVAEAEAARNGGTRLHGDTRDAENISK